MVFYLLQTSVPNTWCHHSNSGLMLLHWICAAVVLCCDNSLYHNNTPVISAHSILGTAALRVLSW